MKKKYLQLVEHEYPFHHYALHEALIEDDEIYWIGSKPLATYDDYHVAVEQWGVRERKYSAKMDILLEKDIEYLYDRIDYSEHEEINFD